jgi:CheY-like chemotaxis protein
LLDLSTRIPPLPSVISTEHDDLTLRIEVERLGARTFLAGPLSAQRLLSALQQANELNQAVGSKVMLVDDDPDFLALLRVLLQPLALQLETVQEASAFWTTLERFQPELLILDVAMPYCSGIELCGVVRADPRWHELPIIFLTAHSDAETARRAFAEGADDFLSKPVDAAELGLRILNRLSRAPRHPQ